MSIPERMEQLIDSHLGRVFQDGVLGCLLARMGDLCVAEPFRCIRSTGPVGNYLILAFSSRNSSVPAEMYPASLIARRMVADMSLRTSSVSATLGASSKIF